MDFTKRTKGKKLVSRRRAHNSTRYLSMESTSSLVQGDDNVSVNSLGHNRLPTQPVFYDQDGNNNDNKKARSSGIVSYLQDLLSKDTDQKEEQIILENTNNMLDIEEDHGTNSVNGPMRAMIH
ncbi:hypothetical protein ACH5RR_018290 [Cinchona calisaya]|uniref:Uncharacterized protein n=1 Tax=Cinchona calisaya TaxID=153742 RepID=A0ABD2ZL49_9GENT